MKFQAFLGVFVLLLIGAHQAHADAPPPIGYVEHCTLQKQEKEPDTCEACSNGQSVEYSEGKDKCTTTYKPQGYVKLCQTRGASAWTEIWCKNPEGKALYKEGEYNQIGCSTLGDRQDVFLSIIALAFILGLIRRAS